MSKIIAVSNQKGGVGKTTTAVNLAASLGMQGKKILVIDLDPQGNLTSGFGIDKNVAENSSYELMLDDADIKDCIIRRVCKNVDLIPANMNLSAAEIELIDAEEKEYILRRKVSRIRNNYSYIIIDCPPALSLLTINAMTTADSILVPIQCEFYSLEGLGQLIHTIDLVKDRLNEELEIEGIMFTMFDRRANLTNQVVQNVKDNLDYYIFDTVIPRNIRLAEAPSFGLPITEYAKSSTGAAAYRELAKELIRKGKRQA